MNVLVIDVGGTHVKILATGQTEPSIISIRADADRPGGWSPRSRSSPTAGSTTWCRSAIRARSCATGRLPSRTTSDAAGSGSISRRRSAVRCKVINDAAMQALGQLQGRQDAVPRPRHRARHGHDRRRHRRADGARAPALQEGHLRRLCRPGAAWNASARRNGGVTSPTWWSA